jgi:glycosyltransferase involved in cell wall biosynthesis
MSQPNSDGNSPYNSRYVLSVEATCLAKERSGIGRYTFELVSALENLGQNTNLYTLEQAANIPEINNLRSKKIYLNDIFRKILWVLFDQIKFLRIDWFLLAKPDFLIFPNFKYLRSNIPSITIIHDISYTKRENWTSRGFNKRINRWGRVSTASNTKIATVSSTVAKEISDYYGIALHEILILKPGIASSMINCKLVEPQSKRGFLVVGTFEKRKNITSVVKAFNILDPEGQRQNPLTIVGRNGNDSHEINSLAKDNPYITIINNIKDEDLISQYQSNAYLISGSNYEGYGMQIAEAMHFGLGLLLSDLEVHREVSGGFAEFFPVNDISILAEKLNLLNMSYPKAYIDSAKKLTLGYTWDATARVLLDHINNVIKK